MNYKRLFAVWDAILEQEPVLTLSKKGSFRGLLKKHMFACDEL